MKLLRSLFCSVLFVSLSHADLGLSIVGNSTGGQEMQVSDEALKNGWEYLLVSNVTPQKGAPTNQAGHTRVIQFEYDGAGGILALEAGKGSTITTSIPSKRILFSFPAVKVQGSALPRSDRKRPSFSDPSPAPAVLS